MSILLVYPHQSSKSFSPGSLSFPLGKPDVPYNNSLLPLGLSFPICNVRM